MRIRIRNPRGNILTWGRLIVYFSSAWEQTWHTPCHTYCRCQWDIGRKKIQNFWKVCLMDRGWKLTVWIVYKGWITCTSAVSPTGNSHGPFRVRLKKKLMKLKMFLMLLAICDTHRKLDHFNIIDLLETPPPPSRQDLICSKPNWQQPRPFNSSV